MKYIAGVAALALAIYAGIQSYLIAQVGILNQIPQLEGDGGGGVAFAVLCFITAILVLFKPMVSVILFVVSALLALLVGLTYQDPIPMYWSLGPLVLAAAIVVNHYLKRRKLGHVKAP